MLCISRRASEISGIMPLTNPRAQEEREFRRRVSVSPFALRDSGERLQASADYYNTELLKLRELLSDKRRKELPRSLLAYNSLSAPRRKPGPSKLPSQ